MLQAGTERQVKQAITVLTETRRALYRILAGDDPDHSPEGSDRVEGAVAPGPEAPEAPEAPEG